MNSTASAWPDITLSRWADTAETLHLWTQIVGKVRLRLSPRQAHCWNCTLYLTTRGLTTSTIPHGSEEQVCRNGVSNLTDRTLRREILQSELVWINGNAMPAACASRANER